MKTPREILLKQHESADRKLDALREQVLTAEFGHGTRNTEHAARSPATWPLRFAFKLWSELVRPAPRIWAGFAVVWLVIAALHLAGRDRPAAMATISQPGSAGGLLNWREQENILADFTVPAPPAKLEPPNSAEPKPRSQWRSRWRLG